MKKRVAIWLYGGIGTGNFSQGQPVLEKLIRELCTEFEIVVYSQSLVNEDYAPKDFRIRSASRDVRNGTLRWFLLVKYFLMDHYQRGFSLMCAFWGFPAGFLTTLIAKALFLPSLVNLQGGDSVGIASLNYGVMLRPGSRRLALWTYQHATALTVLTYFQKNSIRGYGVSRPVRIIPLGADPSLFKLSLNRKNQGEPCKFIHVSNHNAIKDPMTLLKAFALICEKKEARLRIIGGEYGESTAKQLCRELGMEEKVDFYGPAVYSAMPEHYAWADLMLHTSLYEGQGIVIAEAAMCGVLIAGTSVGLISDLGDRGAVVVPPGDFRLLAEKVLETIENPALGDEKKRMALTWARQHDFFWTVDQYKKTFNEIA